MPSPCITRLGNATQRPGLIGKTTTVCQTSAQVKDAAAAKKAAKDAKDAARIASIHRAAEFESTALDNKDLIDATPRPNFTPKANPLHTGDILETDDDSGTYKMTDEGECEHVYLLCDSFVTVMSQQLLKGWLTRHRYLSQRKG